MSLTSADPRYCSWASPRKQDLQVCPARRVATARRGVCRGAVARRHSQTLQHTRTGLPSLFSRRPVVHPLADDSASTKSNDHGLDIDCFGMMHTRSQGRKCNSFKFSFRSLFSGGHTGFRRCTVSAVCLPTLPTNDERETPRQGDKVSAVRFQTLSTSDERDTPCQGDKEGPRRILFLDVDGVLHPWSTRSLGAGCFVSMCLDELQRIVRLTDVEIVISSSWRLKGELRNALAQVLADYGLGFTRWTRRLESNTCSRAWEIFAFVEEERKKGGTFSFAILDDENILDGLRQRSVLELLGPRLVQTDPVLGLRRTQAENVVNLLSGQ
eukprot:TRINITY_DN51577_c0_g1_i2.p1 TRINITY_DN51577_c0_g1~~TRINITY_DN51577_c0_g1_i2.p1  ORF type:complete len:326 (-),score=43.41 TRINITY_DN51577_c0_g1_i2:151-1128(-)